MPENQELRGGISQPEAMAIQGMLKAKGIKASITKAPNPNFRIKNPYRFGVTVPPKELARAQKILRSFDEKTLRHHKSMIVLRSGELAEVPALRIERCPECNGQATDPPVEGGISHWLIAPPALIIGSTGAWFLHHPARGNAAAYLITGAFALMWTAAAYVPLLFIFGRGKKRQNVRYCARCDLKWDLEEYIVGEVE